MASLAIPYTPERDRTMSKTQAAQGGFRPEAWKTGGVFRFPSNPLEGGGKSGYHESAVTTDLFDYIWAATDNHDGTHSLPKANSPFLKPYKGMKISSATRLWLLQYADEFRTDTAQTILSAPKGEAAGHSGSGLSTERQDKAHDLLRQKILEIAQHDPKNTKGLTEGSLLAFMGAMTVASMAPGEVARKIKTATLKAGPAAKQQWERNRNEAKRRVGALIDQLLPDEQTFVHQHASSFMDSTQVGVTAKRRRVVRGLSPERDEAVVKPGEAAGGSYGTLPTLKPKPSQAPPTTKRGRGLYPTQSFRGIRRKAIV